MAIDTSSMDALVARINATREAMSRPAAQGAKEAGGVDFGQLLKTSLGSVDGAQKDAEGLAQRFQLGDPSVSLEQTMVSIAKANVSFTQMVQVRNRVIAAYHEIMNMQI